MYRILLITKYNLDTEKHQKLILPLHFNPVYYIIYQGVIKCLKLSERMKWQKEQ